MVDYYIKLSEVREAICTVQKYRESLLLKALDLDVDGVLIIISQLIDKIPAADVEEVVRCEDCKNHNRPRLGYCSMTSCFVHSDDFCGYGVRKVGNGK